MSSRPPQSDVSAAVNRGDNFQRTDNYYITFFFDSECVATAETIRLFICFYPEHFPDESR